MAEGHRTLFIYWGRRGLSKFTLELAELAPAGSLFSLSRQNELFNTIRATNVKLLPIDTFHNSSGAALNLPKLIGIRRRILSAIKEHRIDRVVVLMPHVWTPLIAGAVKKTGARYVVIVHDAIGHTGDMTSAVTRWLLEDALKADEVVTLSRHVAKQFIDRFPMMAGKVRVLFHPVLSSGSKPPPDNHRRLVGLLFLGRIMAYKGLPLFVEACEALRVRGHPLRVGVVGEGPLGNSAGRLQALGAEIRNRWVTHDEMTEVAQLYDAVVTPYTEASQSGIIALAHGHGLPVLTTPVGGLVEQVDDERTGLIARNVSAAALAEIMQRYLEDGQLRERLRAGVHEICAARSMAHFLAAITSYHLTVVETHYESGAEPHVTLT